MLPENLQFQISRIIEIAESTQNNQTYMAIKLVLLDTLLNKNGVQYSEDFLHDIAENKQDYLAIPLMAEITKLESGKTKTLGHKYDKKTGKFGTQMIGSFVDFSTQKNGEVLELIGDVRVPKRFEKVCAALQDLYDSNELTFSYEIMASEYKVENGNKYVDKSDKNKLFAMAVVSTPAVESAKALALVAAIESDLDINQEDILEGGEELDMPKTRDINRTCEDMFAETKTFLSAELDNLQDVFKSDWYSYDIIYLFMTYVILQNYSTGDFYKVSFTVSDSDVTLSGDPVKVTISFVETAAVNAEKEEKNKMDFEKLQAELATANAKIATLETEVTESKVTIAAKETEIASLNAQIVAVGEQLTAKDAEIASLTPYKEQIETAETARIEVELAAKKTALKEKCEKILKTEEMAEIAEAIEALDENKINAVLAAKYVAVAEASKKDPKPAEKKTLIASRMTDEIRIEGSGSSLIMRK